MIVNLFLTIFSTLLSALTALLPTGGFSTTITTAISNFFSAVYSYNEFLPVDTIFQVLSLTAIFWTAVLVWDFAKWVLHLIRGN